MGGAGLALVGIPPKNVKTYELRSLLCADFQSWRREWGFEWTRGKCILTVFPNVLHKRLDTYLNAAYLSKRKIACIEINEVP